MTITVESKVRVGFSLATVMCLAMAGSAAFTYIRILEDRDTVICAGIVALGFLAWLGGAVVGLQGGGAKRTTAEHPLACILKPRYLSLIVMTAAMLTYAYTTYNRHQKLKSQIAPRAVVTRAPVVFPELKLHSVICNGDHSTALINGQVLSIGEDISNVRLTQIHSNSVEVELEGERKTIVMSQ